jgi:hypothetical protein
MNAQTKPAKALVDSPRLRDYKLTKPQQALLEKFDKLSCYMATSGKTPPCLRLRRVDFIELDASIRAQSGGKRTLSGLTHRDVPVLSASE